MRMRPCRVASRGVHVVRCYHPTRLESPRLPTDATFLALFALPLVKSAVGTQNSSVDYETLDPDLVTRPKVRSAEPEPAALGSDTDHADVGPAIAAPAAALGPASVIGLQRSAGNAAVTALLQRKMAEAEEEELSASPVLDVVGKGGGEPLSEELRDEMEARLGDDFSDVRVHANTEAAGSASAVSARAYTVGNEIVLGEDAPALDSDQGKHTLAHELTHVIQQRNGPVSGTPTGDGISVSDPSDRFEQAAELNATQVMSDSGSPVHSPSGTTGGPGLALAQRAVTDGVEGEEEEGETESELVEPELPEEEVETGEGEEEEVQGLWVQRDETEDEETKAEVEANSEEMEEESKEDEAAAETQDEEAETEVEEEQAEAESENEAEEAEEEAM